MFVDCTTSSPRFTEILKQLETHREELTTTEYTWSLQTIQALSYLWERRAFLAVVSDESMRNAWITNVTHLMAEPGLIPGKTPNQILESLALRVQAFQNAYRYHTEQKAELVFFKTAFLGPPCFNGRLITMEEHLYQQTGWKSPLYFERNLEIDPIAVQVENIMYTYEHNSPPTLQELRPLIEDMLKENGFPLTLIYSTYQRACDFYVGDN